MRLRRMWWVADWRWNAVIPSITFNWCNESGMTISLCLFKILWTVVRDDFRTSTELNSPPTNPNGGRTQNTILRPTYSSLNWYDVQQSHQRNSLSYIHLFFFIVCSIVPLSPPYMIGSLSFFIGAQPSASRVGPWLLATWDLPGTCWTRPDPSNSGDL